MKYAFTSFSCPRATLPELLDLARRYGYNGVEPRADVGHAHGLSTELSPAQRRAVVRQVSSSGIEIACLGVSDMNAAFARRETAAAVVEDIRRKIELAGDLGVRKLRIFGGVLSEGMPRVEAVDLVADCLRRLVPDAQSRSVLLCLETHDAWCDPLHVGAVMCAVGSPWVAVNWDIMHPVRQGFADMAGAHATLRPWIQYVHFHDGTLNRDALEFRPCGSGEYDVLAAMVALVTSGYNGWISGEWIKSDGIIDLGFELRAMKSLHAQAVRSLPAASVPIPSGSSFA